MFLFSSFYLSVLFRFFYPKSSTLSVTASPVPAANMIPDRIVASENKFDAVDAALATDPTGSVDNTRPVNLSRYRYKEV